MVGAAALAAIVVGIVGWVRPLPADGGATATRTPVPVPRDPAASTPADVPVVGESPTAATPTAVPSPSRTKAAPTSSTPAPVTRLAVVVLNETRTTGLAATVAARLRALGWVVPAIGNYRGSVPSTTVFYPPGAQPAAQALARVLGGSRTAPVLPGMSTSRLTVVLTGNPFG